MKLTPTSYDDLAAALQTASRAGRRIETVDLSQLHRVRRYAPEDMTVTVEAGLTLGALQAELGRHGQWLPVDPPGAEDLSLAEILDRNLSGPRRHGYGTLREHLLGVRVALADGRLIRSGGEVVKNVAGYDLLKLFVGAERSLGVVVEAAFKLQPRPELEAFVQRPCASWDDVERLSEAVNRSPITPVVFDLHALSPARGRVATLVLGFAGNTEEVEWQLGEAGHLGVVERCSLGYASELAGAAGRGTIQRWSVAPAQLVPTLRRLDSVPFVARAGLGVVEQRGPIPALAQTAPPGPMARRLMERVKATFDPAGILPPPPAVAASA